MRGIEQTLQMDGQKKKGRLNPGFSQVRNSAKVSQTAVPAKCSPAHPVHYANEITVDQISLSSAFAACLCSKRCSNINIRNRNNPA